MKPKTRTRSCCSNISFIPVVVLIIATSALPVKSNAFTIVNNGDDCRGGANIYNPATKLRPLLLKEKGQRLVTFKDNSSALFSDSSVDGSGADTVDVATLRGGNTSPLSFVDEMNAFVSKNFFLIGMLIAVSFAKLIPELGRNGSAVRPELFIGKYGVTTIFLISGLSLKLTELTNAAASMKLNGLIQMITFGAWPFLVGLPLTKGIELIFPNLLPHALLEGLLIMSCLPTTINMCILLTSAAGGSVATALCNTVISNLIGIFITPALLLQFFGRSIELPFLDLVKKLCSNVLLPVAVGQTLRSTPMRSVYSNHTGFFKRLQEIVLLGIVWNAFCNAFTSGLGLEVKHAVALLALLPVLHAATLTSMHSFFSMKLFGFTRRETIAAAFCSSHKTLAFGLPLINTIFEGNPHLASYCAPIMFMHPLQLVIGSLIAPYFAENLSGDE